MPDIFDIDPTKNYFAFYVGPNGSGKSIAIGSWMKQGSIYYFDFDGRMNSVANWYKQRGLQAGQLTYDTYGPTNLYDSYEKLSRFAESCPHTAIVVDSFTAVTVSAVNYSIRKRSGKGGVNAPKNSKGEMIIPDWDEFNGEAMFVTMALDLCKQIAANGTAVFWTGHPVVRTKIEASGGGKIGKVSHQTKYAAFGTKSDSLVPIYFNEIYHFYTEWDYENQRPMRICQTQPEGDIAAKTALNLPVKFEWTNQDFRTRFLEELAKGDAQNAVTLT